MTFLKAGKGQTMILSDCEVGYHGSEPTGVFHGQDMPWWADLQKGRYPAKLEIILTGCVLATVLLPPLLYKILG